MTAATTLSVRWRPREDPLRPCAVIGAGNAATLLGRLLLTREGGSLARLSGAAARSLLVVTGPEDDLPWADGVVYLGRDPAAPSLLLPTRALPNVPLALFERAMLRAHPTLGAPIVVAEVPSVVLSVSAARALTRARVEAWLARGP